MPTSVRLDFRTEILLRRLAKQSNKTRSAILREAIERFAVVETASEASEGPYASVSDLVGLAAGGPQDLAKRHKAAIRAKLRQRERRR